MTGTGSAGCTVNLVLADAVPALQAAVGREYDRRTGLRGRVYPVAVVDGAGPVSTVEDRRVRGGGSGRFPVAV
jgi:galactokinase